MEVLHKSVFFVLLVTSLPVPSIAQEDSSTIINLIEDPDPTAQILSESNDQNIVTRVADLMDEEEEQGSNTPAFQLMDKLLSRKNYDKRVRPRRKSTKSVMVTFRMNLYQILDVIEPSQTIVLHTWVTQMWQDEFLGWDPSKFGGIDWAVVPYEEIWLPDTFLYNGLEMSQTSAERLINVLLETKNDTGVWVADVRLMYPAIYKFSCKLQVAMFPFDVQRCNVTIGAWTHNMAAINYTTESEYVMLENYVGHDEWSLLSFKWLREEVKFSCCPVPWVLLHAQLRIQRKPLFYLVNLVLPSVVITLVAVAGFYMPANTSGERSEKVNLGITTLLAMAILLLMVVEAMPSTSESIPLIGIFYLTVIIVISMGTLITAIVIIIQKKGAYGCKLSNCGRTIAICVAKLIGINAKPQLKKYWLELRLQKNNGSINNNNGVMSKKEKKRATGLEDDVTLFNRDHHQQTSEELGMHEVGGEKDRLKRSDEMTAEEDLVRMLEWEFVADVIDRSMLFVFTALVSVVTSLTLWVGWIQQESGVIG